MTDRQFATATDGTRIAYRIWGDPAAQHRVALVHALAMTAEFWSETAQILAPECAVLAVDCRGHGASDKPEGPFTVELFAEDLAAVLDHCGWTDCIVGGASMGGCVAQAFGHLYPDRTRGLALVDTTGWYGPDAPSAWEDRAQKAVENGLDSLIPFQKTRWFSDAFRDQNPEKVDTPVAVFLANSVPAYVETCRMLGRCDLRAASKAMIMPVEIVVGEEDYATPVEMAQALHDRLSASNLTQLPGVRHFTPMEVPGDIADAIRRVVART